MSAEQLFRGFTPYEGEARQRWGDEAVDAANARARGLDAERARWVQAEFEAVHSGMARFRADGVEVDDPRVQQLTARHHAVVSVFWEPDAEAYRGLGQLYVDDPRFRASIGRGDDDVVEYLRRAMVVHADTVLSVR